MLARLGLASSVVDDTEPMLVKNLVT